MRSPATAPLLALASLALACGSTEPTRASSAPVVEPAATDTADPATPPVTEVRRDRFAPVPKAAWTGGFTDKAVLLARTIRIEGPEGLLDHVAVASGDDLFDRTVETTPQGLLQVVRRVSDEVPVVRGNLDGWRLAATERVVVLERVTPGPVRVVATGEVMWRDVDGHLVRGERVEVEAEIGSMEPVRPAGAEATTDLGHDQTNTGAPE